MKLIQGLYKRSRALEATPAEASVIATTVKLMIKSNF